MATKKAYYLDRINIFKSLRYWRLALLLVAFGAFCMWLIFGFDSGMGQPLSLLKDLPNILIGKTSWSQAWSNAYKNYGLTGHFSAPIIYCLLMIGHIIIFERLGFNGAKNILLSVMLTFVQVAWFEQWYITSFAVFQNPRYFHIWYVSDPICLFVFIFSYFVASYSILYIWAWSYHNDGTRNYRFHLNKYAIITISIFIASMFLWWFYPFPFTQYGTRFFPQTVYPEYVYVHNDGIHAVNIFVKAMASFTQYMVLNCFKRETC